MENKINFQEEIDDFYKEANRWPETHNLIMGGRQGSGFCTY